MRILRIIPSSGTYAAGRTTKDGKKPLWTSSRLIRTTKLYYFIAAKQLSRLLFNDFPMHRQIPLYKIRALRQDP